MKVSVKVKAGAREDRVDRIDEGNLRVSVKAQAKEGKANQAVIGLLSRYFDIPKSRITILKGHTSKNKILQIGDGSCYPRPLAHNRLQSSRCENL